MDYHGIESFIANQETKYAAVLRPYDYILRNRQTVALESLVRFMQDAVRHSLSLFVGSFWMYPFWEGRSYLNPFHVETHILKTLLNLQEIADLAEERFGYFGAFRLALAELKRKPGNREITVAKVYRTFYHDFESAVAQGLPYIGLSQKPGCPLLNVDNYPARYSSFVKPLVELQREAHCIRDSVRGFYLHGSLSTMDFIPHWSDVDTLVIITRETLERPQRLVRLRRQLLQLFWYFLQFDPLQFHGFFVASEYDLDYYPEVFFPLILFGYSKSFFDNDTAIDVKLRQCRAESLRIFWTTVRSFLEKAGRDDSPRTNFERKTFLHNIFNFPLFYLQAKGEHVYKRDSFDRARPDFSPEAWQAIELATEIMRSWHHEFRFNRQLNTVGRVNPKLFMKVLNRCYDSRILSRIEPFEAFDRHYRQFAKLMAALVRQGWELVAADNQEVFAS